MYTTQGIIEGLISLECRYYCLAPLKEIQKKIIKENSDAYDVKNVLLTGLTRVSKRDFKVFGS